MKEIREARKYEQLDNPDSYNSQIRKGWMPFWVKNAAENYQAIKAEFEQDNVDAGMLTQKEHPDNVLLLGSGPSLNDIEPYLKDWKGDIMVSSSQLAFCEALGITPNYCFIIDADPTQAFLVTEAKTKDITLITHANMDPVVLKAWDGPKYYFRMQDPGDEWFGEHMPMMYGEFMDLETSKRWPGIQAFVLNSGNVSNTMIAVSNFLHYKRSFLCGVDLGFPNDEYRFLNYTRKDGGYVQDLALDRLSIPESKPLKEGHNGVPTDQVSCFYKYSTLILYGMDNPNVYSCSRGILTEIPYVSPQEVVECQGDIDEKYFVEHEDKYKVAQEYLRYRGIYVMKGKPRVKVKPSTKEKFERTKKIIIRWMIFGNKLKRTYTPDVRKNILKMMMPAPRIKFRLWLVEWEFSPEETKRALLGYTGITNKFSVKGIKRLALVIRFNVGRVLCLW